MNSKPNFYKLSVLIIGLILITSCNNTKDLSNYNKDKHIYLYGEEHGLEDDIKKEFILWKNFYDNHGMRNLFLEVPNYVAGYLNLWMNAEDDKILEILRDQYKYSQGNNLIHYGKLLRLIKTECPETVFYGTDLSSFNDTLGQGYLKLLDNNQDRPEIDRVKAVMDQGEKRNTYLDEYKEKENEELLIKAMEYREEVLLDNFIYEFDRLEDKRIMGIYGAYHLDNPEGMQIGDAEIMGIQIKNYYNDIVEINILSELDMDN